MPELHSKKSVSEAEVNGFILLQSSMCRFFIHRSLEYVANANAVVHIHKHRVITAIARVLLFGGFSRLGMTPEGGVRAGPFKIISCSARGSR